MGPHVSLGLCAHAPGLSTGGLCADTAESGCACRLEPGHNGPQVLPGQGGARASLAWAVSKPCGSSWQNLPISFLPV